MPSVPYFDSASPLTPPPQLRRLRLAASQLRLTSLHLSFFLNLQVEFNRTYRIDSWGWNGPELVTRVASRFPQGPQLHILPTSAFYAIHWAKARAADIASVL